LRSPSTTLISTLSLHDALPISVVVRSFCGAAPACQLDRLSHFVSSATDRNDRVISEVGPYFVGLRNIERLSGIPAEAFRFLDHLACAEVHGDETLVCLAGNEQTLSFDVHG